MTFTLSESIPEESCVIRLFANEGRKGDYRARTTISTAGLALSRPRNSASWRERTPRVSYTVFLQTTREAFHFRVAREGNIVSSRHTCESSVCSGETLESSSPPSAHSARPEATVRGEVARLLFSGRYYRRHFSVKEFTAISPPPALSSL